MDAKVDMHPFDTAIALATQPDGSYLGQTSPAYGNMVGPFGGLTAAQAINAVMQHPERLGEPVALTVNFCVAVADGPFTVTARPVRTNRSTQHWVIELAQAEGPVVTATAFTALRRNTLNVTEQTMPTMPPIKDVPPSLTAPVEWIKRYEMRFTQGNFPAAWDGADQGNSISQLWLRDNPPRPLDFCSLTAMSDLFFPRIWFRRARFVPAGTVSLTTYIHADAAQLQAVGTGYLLGQARAQIFNNGYFDQTAQLWSEAGTLLVTSHQIVYYKE